MAKYRVYGTVVGGKYLGIYEANSEAEAIKMAEDYAHVGLCHQCSRQIDDLEITKIEAELEDENHDQPTE